MRRSKVKATICLGRKKPEASRKSKEISEGKPDIKAALNDAELEIVNNTESVSPENASTGLLSSTHLTSPKTSVDKNSSPSMVELTSAYNPKSLPTGSSSLNTEIAHLPSSSPVTSQTSKDANSSEVHNECTPTNTVPSQDVFHTSPKSVGDAITSISVQEKLHVPPNCSTLNRKKVKAVPKVRVRKTASNMTVENAEVKSMPVVTLSEVVNSIGSEETVPTCVQEKHVPKNSSIPPLSPSKLCRNKIKVIPILGNRRYHTASDSEETNKKSYSSRTRTESQSSSISGIQDITDDPAPTQKKVDHILDVKRKMRKSDGSKKLAEARKEFLKKFSDSTPDYKKLTMMDLIFYNPTTNPMKYEKKKAKKQISDSTEQDEDVDNPAEPTNEESPENDEPTEKSDDEDEIVAPRIKVGPTGEIILDEKSLVIENKKAKKAAEAIEKSKLYDGDVDRPYGVYKRFKRCKWSHSDTLKFYRALSSVGTDFALMSELFSNRTRRELKLKFKKEEKDNRELVDQAIMRPCSFNFEELKTEFKMMEMEEHEIEQQQLNKRELMRKKQDKKTQKFAKLMEGDTTGTSSENVVDGDTTVEKTNEVFKRKRESKPKPPNLPKLPKPRKPQKKMDILSAMSESEDSEDDSDSDFESLVLSSTHTTRYGRKTKRREIFEPNFELDEEVVLQKRIRTANPEPEPVQKPGSLMVVSSETSDGQPLVKIFMVTDETAESNEDQGNSNTKNLLPIAMIRTGHADEEVIIENNYTIPASTEESNTEKHLEDNVDIEREEEEMHSVISEEQK